MAYVIQGQKLPLVFCSNYCVSSSLVGKALVGLGGEQQGGHYGTPDLIPDDAVIAQTVRSHFDVLASCWRVGDHALSFDSYVQRVLDGHHRYLRPDAFYGQFGEWDYILRYETLQFELDTLFLHVGLPEVKLPFFGPNVQKAHSETLFSRRLQDKVTARYGDELERIGYGVA